MSIEDNADEAAPIPVQEPVAPHRWNAMLTMFFTGIIIVALVLSYAVFSAGLSPARVAVPAIVLPVTAVNMNDLAAVKPDSAPDRGRTDEIPAEPTTPATPDVPTPDVPTPDGTAPDNPAAEQASIASRVSDYPSVSSRYADASLPQQAKNVGRGYLFGKKKAGKNIIMWIDLQCLSCAVLHRDVAAPMRETVERGTGNVEYFVASSLGPGSRIAANALGCAADQGRFYEFLDQAYAYQLQGNTTGSQLTRKDMIRWGNDLNMPNKSEYISCVKKGTYFDYADGIQELSGKVGIAGTPTMYADQEDVIANLTTFPAFLATIGLPEDAFPVPGQ